MLRDPSLEIVDNKIVIRRDPSSTELALGDMRVWYESLPPGDYTVLAVQADERSLLGSERSDQLVIQAGLLDAEQFLEQQGEQASESSNGILYMGTVSDIATLKNIAAAWPCKFTFGRRSKR